MKAAKENLKKMNQLEKVILGHKKAGNWCLVEDLRIQMQHLMNKQNALGWP